MSDNTIPLLNDEQTPLENMLQEQFRNATSIRTSHDSLKSLYTSFYFLFQSINPFIVPNTLLDETTMKLNLLYIFKYIIINCERFHNNRIEILQILNLYNNIPIVKSIKQELEILKDLYNIALHKYNELKC